MSPGKPINRVSSSLRSCSGTKSLDSVPIPAMDTVDERWRACTLLSFIGVAVLVFVLKQSRDGSGFFSPRIIALMNPPPGNQSDPTVMPPPGNQSDSMVTDSSSLIETEYDIGDRGGECNLFDGKWVYDPKLSPMYTGPQCPFLSDQVSCQRNHRPDSRYEQWSWEGNRCDIPRFNGTDMLERLRGKRVAIIGDSLNRNQFESLACLLYSSIPSSETHINVKSGTYKVFRATSYNCSVEFYWSPFLVRPEPNRVNGSSVLRLDRVSASARKWRGARVMVFNTGHWWTKLNAWDFLEYKGELTQSMEMEKAFKRAMKTWAKWVDKNVNQNETTVFFRTISPEHKGRLWCHNVTEPSLDGDYYTSFPKSISTIAENTVRKMKTPVKSLNITRLSEYRRDGHPMVYTTKHGELLTEEQRKKPEVYGDCSHWCLPGVPDTWNRLLYAFMVLDELRDGPLVSLSSRTIA